LTRIVFDFSQLEFQTVGIDEGQVFLSEVNRRLVVNDIFFIKTLRPKIKASFGNRIADLRSHARTSPTLGSAVAPREKRQDGSRASHLVAEVKVIGSGIVKVDGLFDEPQAERPGIKVEIALGVAGDRRDVVQT